MLLKKQRPYNIWGRNIFPISMEGCTLYLPLWQEDMQGSTLFSYDPYHHSCAVTEAVWGTTGRTFDATNDKIGVTVGAEVRYGTGNWSMSYWVYKVAHAANDFFFRRNTNLMYLRANVNGSVSLIVPGAAGFTSNVDAYDAGVFTFVTVQRSGDNYIVRKNGAAFQTAVNAAASGDISGADVRIDIGIYSSNNAFDGIIGEVLEYSRAISAGEDTHNYEITRGRYM